MSRAYEDELLTSGFMQSQDTRGQCGEEGMTEEGEEEGMAEEEGMVEECEDQEAGGERRSTDLTLDQKTFLIMQKSSKATHNDIVRRWSDRFTRKPPSRRTVWRVLKRARVDNSIKSRKCNSGRKRTVRTKAMIEEGQALLTPSMLAMSPPEEQKKMLGESLFPLIEGMYPDLAGKITGMLLDLDVTELMWMLEDTNALTEKVSLDSVTLLGLYTSLKVEEAVSVLQAYQRKTEEK